MPRQKDPNAKIRNPAYIAERNRQIRHLNHAQVSIRIPESMLANWHAAATEKNISLKDWMVEVLEREYAEMKHDYAPAHALLTGGSPEPPPDA